MRVALVNPPWSFEGSIYFGCREPHLPLELAYAKALLEATGHEALLVDAQMAGLRPTDVRRRLEAFAPDMTVITTAPSYLFWRSAPPEMRVPQQLAAAVREVAGILVVVGPHASTTPRAVIRKLGASVAVLGECEEVLPKLASTPRSRWVGVDSIAWAEGRHVRVQSPAASCDVTKLPALRWPSSVLAQHLHHHQRFERKAEGAGAEVEASRGCPYADVLFSKDERRGSFRRRPLRVVLEEVDALLGQGVRYVYFIDETFLPNRELLEALSLRDLAFGVQLRIEDWSEGMLDLLGRAGCVSAEASVEGTCREPRLPDADRSQGPTERAIARLVDAKRYIPFVQANLIDAAHTDEQQVGQWRRHLQDHGVWANEPAPVFPYPGSPDYALRWGALDDDAWERAHAYYLAKCRALRDSQGSQPISLSQLELPDAGR